MGAGGGGDGGGRSSRGASKGGIGYGKGQVDAGLAAAAGIGPGFGHSVGSASISGPGAGTQAVGQWDARTVPVSPAAKFMGLSTASRQANLDRDVMAPEYRGGGDKYLPAAAVEKRTPKAKKPKAKKPRVAQTDSPGPTIAETPGKSPKPQMGFEPWIQTGMDFAGYVEQSPDLLKAYNKIPEERKEGMSVWGWKHWERHGKKNPNRKITPMSAYGPVALISGESPPSQEMPSWWAEMQERMEALEAVRQEQLDALRQQTEEKRRKIRSGRKFGRLSLLSGSELGIPTTTTLGG